jgi:hypothetical protein
MRTIEVDIIGTAPLMIHKFSQKAREQMRAKQEAGSTANKKRNRRPKDFDAVFEGARHKSIEGWDGIPAAAFRAAMINSCRLVNFKMTIAKLCLFIEADGLDADEGTPLVRIIGGPPERNEMVARNETGVADVRLRPMWREWGARLRIRYDAQQFTATDVVNLLNRAGAQNGVGEGRANSRNSAGMGLGFFRVAEGEETLSV